jgi:hypothetical protein
MENSAARQRVRQRQLNRMSLAALQSAATGVDPAVLNKSVADAQKAATDAAADKAATDTANTAFSGKGANSFGAAEEITNVVNSGNKAAKNAAAARKECDTHKAALEKLTSADALQGPGDKEAQAKALETQSAEHKTKATEHQADADKQKAGADAKAKEAETADAQANQQKGLADTHTQNASAKDKEAADAGSESEQKTREAASREEQSNSLRQVALEKGNQKQKAEAEAKAQQDAADANEKQAGTKEAEARSLREQANNAESAAKGKTAAAEELKNQAAKVTDEAQKAALLEQAKQAENEAKSLAAQAETAKQNASAADGEAARLKQAAEGAKSAAAKAAASANSLGEEAKKAADDAEDAGKQAAKLTEDAKAAAGKADEAKKAAHALRDQAAAAVAEQKKAEEAAVAARNQAKELGDKAAAAKKNAEDATKAAEDAAKNAAALKKQVEDFKNTKEYQELDAAAKDLKKKEDELKALVDPAAKEAKQKEVNAARAAAAQKAMALNALEAKEELKKAEDTQKLAEALAQPFAASTADCPGKKQADEALDQAKKAAADLKKLNDTVAALQKLHEACAAAAKSAAEAKAVKDAAVATRITQLKAAPGHGPQRHQEADGDKRKRKLGERALYKHDPETGRCVETNGRLHAANENASTFPDPDDYVLAEAECRKRLKAQVCPGGGPPPPLTSARKDITPPVSDVLTNTVGPAGGPKTPNQACAGLADTRPRSSRAMVMTSKGPAPQVPIKAGVVKYYPPPPAINKPTGLSGPQATLSNANFKPYEAAATEFFINGGSVAVFEAEFISVYNTTVAGPPVATPAAATAAAITAAKLKPKDPTKVVSDPPLPAEMDQTAMGAAIDNSTGAIDFAGGEMFSLYEASITANPCGDWSLITMYPGTNTTTLPNATKDSPMSIPDLREYDLGKPTAPFTTAVTDAAKLPPGTAFTAGPPPKIDGTPTAKGDYVFEVTTTDGGGTAITKPMKITVK